MTIKKVANFIKGLVTSVEDYSLADGSYSKMLNWITKGDKVEMRRGMLLLGTEITGTGQALTHTAYKNDGTELLYRIRDLKVEYYNTTTEDWVEVGTNILPSTVALDDVSFQNYQSASGSQLWIASPKFMYKFMPDAPASYVDIANTTYIGFIKIRRNRMYLWGRDADPVNLYLSHIDNLTGKIDASTGVVADEVVGALGSATYSGTLEFKAAGAKRSAFAVQIIEAGGETFTDNRDGTLTGDAGGTGTINYISGAYSVTFNAITSGAVTADYIWEDPTSDGIADFSYSSTRLAAEGDIFLQGGSGNLKSIESYGDDDYCFHERDIWKITLSVDDTNATNEIYRRNMGVENWRSTEAAGNGIYFVDSQGEKSFRLLTLAQGSSEVIPRNVSELLDLSGYEFDKAEIFQFEDFVLFACRQSGSSNNDRVFLLNLDYNSFDLLEYFVSNFATYDSGLHAGDSGNNSVLELLSGLDDDDSLINNSLEFGLTNLGIEELKKQKKLIVQGSIGVDQEATVSMSFDNGAFVEVGTILGSGDYVDSGRPVNVGSEVVGRSTVGGDSDSGILAYNYVKEIRLSQGKFEKCKVRVEATKLGWFDISEIRYHDILRYNHKLPYQYRS